MKSVIGLSLGKLLVNFLQVAKRTNTPLIPGTLTKSSIYHPKNHFEGIRPRNPTNLQVLVLITGSHLIVCVVDCVPPK